MVFILRSCNKVSALKQERNTFIKSEAMQWYIIQGRQSGHRSGAMNVIGIVNPLILIKLAFSFKNKSHTKQGTKVA